MRVLQNHFYNTSLVHWTHAWQPHTGALTWKPSQGTKLNCLVNRGTLVWTTCPTSLPDNALAGNLTQCQYRLKKLAKFLSVRFWGCVFVAKGYIMQQLLLSYHHHHVLLLLQIFQWPTEHTDRVYTSDNISARNVRLPDTSDCLQVVSLRRLNVVLRSKPSHWSVFTLFLGFDFSLPIAGA